MRSAPRLNRLFRRLIASAVPLSVAAMTPSCGGQDSASATSSTVDTGDGGGQPSTCPSQNNPGCVVCNTIPDGVSWPMDPDGGATSALHSDQCSPFCRTGTTADCYLNPQDPSGRGVVCVLMCSGRRPSGFEGVAGDTPSDLGAFFADMARLEAASIHAFRVLERELIAHRAPRRLVHMARRASRDERRHTRMTRALGRRYGGTFREPEIAKTSTRSIEAIAIENAVEGCVRETMGALLATYQAERARDPVIREAMKRIARDETRHAELAWRTAAWLRQKLDKVSVSRVADARRAAALELARSPGGAPAGCAAALGLPDTAQMKQLADGMLDTLWS